MSQYSDQIARSREHEIHIYLSSMRAMHHNALRQNSEIYDCAFAGTHGFTEISAEAIISDSRIIRILRYVVVPSISQMKFGQLFGLASTESIERDKISRGNTLESLKLLAPNISAFVNAHLDRGRFIWLDENLCGNVRQLAEAYAKKWTCSLIADQKAQTNYRNWRKTQQEAAIERTLIDSGYIRSSYSGSVLQKTDINIGEYSKERKVKGATYQKADLVVRRKSDGKLLLLEAKAVGVQVDAFKRIKECCDKARDWNVNPALDNPKTIAVIGGFFVEQNLEALRRSSVSVVWEHALDNLRDHL